MNLWLQTDAWGKKDHYHTCQLDQSLAILEAAGSLPSPGWQPPQPSPDTAPSCVGKEHPLVGSSKRMKGPLSDITSVHRAGPALLSMASVGALCRASWEAGVRAWGPQSGPLAGTQGEQEM